ncbi:TPA: cytidylyltransferase [Patescibacteria group bacterium]|nr:MAG: Acylneuraminate cytidylyltransferase [Parcubacteria group bacterium GW2011_GWF2_40_10]KKR58905.1 MAG: Acylneuraminate cytidylyltransferase [Parcubacteria group bacterium GW2011_GWC2_40_31]KKR75414.1 MAG: Acylneuraminate cytidylyltransferase [Parcubacteria group bacterium GW2011_GWB2_40_8]KKR81067.1 MAG: Acylneuraminate cytidylyltransferase [Parcubacteria group bacterium GW2011_GWD2_40_9]HCI04369.1 cytidylyltransferase [Patescibacteria group bacterium]
MKIIALIPARGGSKSIPKKNIMDLGGFPLIAYSIAAAKLSKKINRVIVDTDNEEIAGISKKFGAEIPYLRPKEFATDTSTDFDFMNHSIEWFRKNEKEIPDFIVHLRPTTPLREPSHIDEAIEKIIINKKATSLRSGYEMRESPYKLFGIKNDFFIGLFLKDKRPEYWNLPRQAFPPVYQPDGYVDIIIPKFVIKNKKLHGNKILAYKSPDTGEIDKMEDLKFAEFNLQKNNWEIYQYLKNNF